MYSLIYFKNNTVRHISRTELHMLGIVLPKSTARLAASCTIENICRKGTSNRISVSLEITCFGTIQAVSQSSACNTLIISIEIT